MDATIRKLTNDSRSIDDFCHIFYAPPDGEPVIKTYTFDDLVATLNESRRTIGAASCANASIPPAHTRRSAELPAVAGNSFTTTSPTNYIAAGDAESGGADFTSSIGLRVKGDGTVIDAIPGMPAFEAGISPYLKIVAVNGRQFSVDELKRAVRDSKSNSAPIKLSALNANTLETHEIQYHDGNRYPHLERVEGTPDYLDEALKSLTPASAH